jgi:hypothetical protein
MSFLYDLIVFPKLLIRPLPDLMSLTGHTVFRGGIPLRPANLRSANLQKRVAKAPEQADLDTLFTSSSATSDTMVVRIRLARFGRAHSPFYNIVVTQARFVALCFFASPSTGLPH